jgi:hypothetical protein
MTLTLARRTLALLALLAASAPAQAQRDPNSFTSLGTLNVTSGTLTINTNTLQMTGAATFTGVSLNQANAPGIAVFNFSNITIGSGVTVIVVGSRALSLLSLGNATIGANINLSAFFSSDFGGTFNPGPGGYSGPIFNGNPVTQSSAGQGPGGGTVYSSASVGNYPGGGGHGGAGGTIGAGIVNGNLLTTLAGGSSGAAYVPAGSYAAAGGGGGALELVAVNTLTVTSALAANGGVGLQTQSSRAGGGAGGGILLSGGTLAFTGSASASGGGTVQNNIAGGGGGGRVALGGLPSYTFGTGVSNVALNGGTPQNAGSGTDGFAGVLTVDAASTTLTSGQTVTLNGTPLVSVPGSINQSAHTVEAYIRRDLVINSGATATLGMDNALRRLNGTGQNVTALTVNCTFNTNGYNQYVATLSGGGDINFGANSTLAVGGGNHAGLLHGAGELPLTPGGLLTLSGGGGSQRQHHRPERRGPRILHARQSERVELDRRGRQRVKTRDRQHRAWREQYLYRQHHRFRRHSYGL